MIPSEDCSLPLEQRNPVGDFNTLGTLVNYDKVECGF